MGMGIAYFLKKESLSILITIFILMIFLIMSDVVVPSVLLNFFPKVMVETFNIFNIFYKLMSYLIILEKDWFFFIPYMMFLGVYYLIFFVFAGLGKMYSKKSYFK